MSLSLFSTCLFFSSSNSSHSLSLVSLSLSWFCLFVAQLAERKEGEEEKKKRRKEEKLFFFQPAASILEEKKLSSFFFLSLPLSSLLHLYQGNGGLLFGKLALGSFSGKHGFLGRVSLSLPSCCFCGLQWQLLLLLLLRLLLLALLLFFHLAYSWTSRRNEDLAA